MGTQRGRESFSGNDSPHGKRVTRKRLPTPFARFQQKISGRVLMVAIVTPSMVFIRLRRRLHGRPWWR